MAGQVRVKFLRRVRLSDRVARPGDVVTLSLDEGRYLSALGWVEIVEGNLALPRGAKPPEGGLLFRV